MADVKIKKEGDPVMQISVMLQNRVGSLSSLMKLIRANGEEIVGFSMQDARDATIIRLILGEQTNVCAQHKNSKKKKSKNGFHEVFRVV